MGLFILTAPTTPKRPSGGTETFVHAYSRRWIQQDHFEPQPRAPTWTLQVGRALLLWSIGKSMSVLQQCYKLETQQDLESCKSHTTTSPTAITGLSGSVTLHTPTNPSDQRLPHGLVVSGKSSTQGHYAAAATKSDGLRRFRHAASTKL